MTDYTLFNRTLDVITPSPVTFAVATKGEVVIESNAPATLTKDGVVVATLDKGRQQAKLVDGTYTLTGDARVTIREISAPQTGFQFGR
jgi:hypothetical protein